MNYNAKPVLQKKWPKKGELIYENVQKKNTISTQSKLKIVIDNFDKILDEFNNPRAVEQPVKKDVTKIPKLQKAKTCAIIESKCILKKSLSQPVETSKFAKNLKSKTKSMVDITLPKNVLQQSVEKSNHEQILPSTKVKEVVQRINLMSKAKSVHDVRIQDGKRLSKIPVKTSTLRKTFPSTPSGLNSLDRSSGGASKKNVQLSLPCQNFQNTNKRDFVPVASREKCVKDVVDKFEDKKQITERKKNVSKQNSDVQINLKVAKEFIGILNRNEKSGNFYLDPKAFIDKENEKNYKLNYSSDDNSDDSGNISNETELDCEEIRCEKVGQVI